MGFRRCRIFKYTELNTWFIEDGRGSSTQTNEMEKVTIDYLLDFQIINHRLSNTMAQQWLINFYAGIERLFKLLLKIKEAIITQRSTKGHQRQIFDKEACIGIKIGWNHSLFYKKINSKNSTITNLKLMGRFILIVKSSFTNVAIHFGLFF